MAVRTGRKRTAAERHLAKEKNRKKQTPAKRLEVVRNKIDKMVDTLNDLWFEVFDLEGDLL